MSNLRAWETRERRKAKDYEKEREKERMKEEEREHEAKRLKEFLEDYDDERDDIKYYKYVEIIIIKKLLINEFTNFLIKKGDVNCNDV